MYTANKGKFAIDNMICVVNICIVSLVLNECVHLECKIVDEIQPFNLF